MCFCFLQLIQIAKECKYFLEWKRGIWAIAGSDLWPFRIILSMLGEIMSQELDICELTDKKRRKSANIGRIG